MFMKRRSIKRTVLLFILCTITFYIFVCALGYFKTPIISHLTELHTCPACYGVSVCPELYSNSISIEDKGSFHNFFNVKNVYYATTKNGKKIVLKKLAHDWELRKYDEDVCAVFNQSHGCKSATLFSIDEIQRKIEKLIRFDVSKSQSVTRGLILCPHTYGIHEVLNPIVSMQKGRNMNIIYANIWFMLNINPEPIILQLLPASRGWRVPIWGGVCGRLALVEHAGVALSGIADISWRRRAAISLQILAAASDFTFKHERFRFYLLDWSLDNIVIDTNDRVTFVDLEDVVIVDKFITPGADLPQWYDEHKHEYVDQGFTFSAKDLCTHRLSDHNFWAACHLLAGSDDAFLLHIPSDVKEASPDLFFLLKSCLHGIDSYKTVKMIEGELMKYLNTGLKANDTRQYNFNYYRIMSAKLGS